VLAVGLLAWLYTFVATVRVIRSVKRIKDLPDPQLAVWPKLSVVVTARNEERRLAQAMEQRLADDYPDLELILVDDSSTDGTPAILDRSAAADPRVKAVHVTRLPEGWLGKLHALRTGAQAAKGEWILFSDGDAFIRPGALRRVIGYVLANGLDHAAVFPEFYPTGLLLDAATAEFARSLAVVFRLWAIEDPASSAAIGSGSFNLVSRAALRRSKGFEHLRMEVGDDLALGIMLKREGCRSTILNGRDYVGVYFYESLGAMARGIERAGWTLMAGFSVSRAFALTLAGAAIELSPFLAFIPVGLPQLRAPGLVLLALAYGSTLGVNLWLTRFHFGMLLWPLGALAGVYLMPRAAILGWRRGGIFWRGTFYPNEQLKAGVRLGSLS
jgi:cellulose synthase/poly-beta-1,6-N-acetylglucosamine synthase-like glycosyltransferase